LDKNSGAREETNAGYGTLGKNEPLRIQPKCYAQCPKMFVPYKKIYIKGHLRKFDLYNIILKEGINDTFKQIKGLFRYKRGCSKTSVFGIAPHVIPVHFLMQNCCVRLFQIF
jgi:hypothetical protein